MSDPIVMTVDISAVDDVPAVHISGHTILEDQPGGLEIQLLATDDPNELDQPLDIFVTALPTRGKVCTTTPLRWHGSALRTGCVLFCPSADLLLPLIRFHSFTCGKWTVPID